MRVFGLFELYTPEALILLLLLPVWWLWRRRRRKDAIVFSRTSVLAAGPGTGSWIPKAIFLLRNLALASLVFALARPRSGAHTETQTSEGINIVLAIDLSSSMLALDFRPANRLEVAKEKVRQFIARRTSDRIGVVAFAGEALTQVPLTTDYPVVMQAVANLQAGQLEDGTAIG
ncbi:MAG TPA: VWA domain-containing protein, partial [Gemmatimonadaceae bacterium]